MAVRVILLAVTGLVLGGQSGKHRIITAKFVNAVVVRAGAPREMGFSLALPLLGHLPFDFDHFPAKLSNVDSAIRKDVSIDHLSPIEPRRDRIIVEVGHGLAESAGIQNCTGADRASRGELRRNALVESKRKLLFRQFLPLLNRPNGSDHPDSWSVSGILPMGSCLDECCRLHTLVDVARIRRHFSIHLGHRDKGPLDRIKRLPTDFIRFDHFSKLAMINPSNVYPTKTAPISMHHFHHGV